jgi:hypothetical protein
MPIIGSQGAAAAEGFGFGLQGRAGAFIEDVFSTWLYTGNGSTQTITNGIDLAGKGGLVWMKDRSNNNTDHALYDTARGVYADIASNTTAAQTLFSGGVDPFRANGFTIGNLAKINTNAATYASWTFRKQPKFFDVVTYTGDGANRTIAHNLGSVPGCIIVKRTDADADWQVYHRSLANTQYLVLNNLGGAATGATRWNSTTPTDTVFSLGTDATVNASGGTYVAYLFAHNAGGFGATGTDNAISCGLFTTDGSGFATVNLGYEPQFVIIKSSTSAVGWYVVDAMRGFATAPVESRALMPNNGILEFGSFASIPTATGFTFEQDFSPNNNFIYIAIRRGPMRTPTSGTSVFSPLVNSGSSNPRLTTNFPFDLQTNANQVAGGSGGFFWSTRLTGVNSTSADSSMPYLQSYSSAAEASASGFAINVDNIGYNKGSNWGGIATVMYNFRRAPSFFDVVCYTGTGVIRTVAHNLGVAPELIIVKRRNSSVNGDWTVGSSYTSVSFSRDLYLNQTSAQQFGNSWNSTAPSASVFTVGAGTNVNATSSTYVAYLFASCPGVSKVGSYTGTGATQVINCGFAAGARFVLIKRTDSTGEWYVWDSARGIVAGNDPYLLLNSTAAEVTTTDWVDTAASGFELSNAGGNLVNTNGASYIFLAIA